MTASSGEEFDDPAVRVELDDSAVPTEVPAAPHTDRRRLVVVLGFMLAVAAVLWLIARPDDGETAANTPITTTVAPSTSGSSPVTSEGLVRFDRVSTDAYPAAAVVDDAGWIGYGPGDASASQLRATIFRSPDGLNWTPVETDLPEDEILDLSKVVVTYRLLTAGESELALWESPDAASWVKIAAREVDGDSRVAGALSPRNAVFVVDVESPQPLPGLASLVSEVFHVEITEAVCGFEREVASFVARSCSGEDLGVVSIDEASERGLVNCLAGLSGLRSTIATVVQIDLNGSIQSTPLAPLEAVFSIRAVDDGVFLGTVSRTGLLGSLVSTACEGLSVDFDQLPSFGRLVHIDARTQEIEVLRERDALRNFPSVEAADNGRTFLLERGTVYIAEPESTEFNQVSTPPRGADFPAIVPNTDWVYLPDQVDDTESPAGTGTRLSRANSEELILLPPTEGNGQPFLITDDYVILRDFVGDFVGFVRVPLN